jgi:oligopeptide/dipeptide ABC transporter ATP-binding protein
LGARDARELKLKGELKIADVSPKACPLLPRCPYAMDICKEFPPTFKVGPGHLVNCWLHKDGYVAL